MALAAKLSSPGERGDTQADMRPNTSGVVTSEVPVITVGFCSSSPAPIRSDLTRVSLPQVTRSSLFLLREVALIKSHIAHPVSRSQECRNLACVPCACEIYGVVIYKRRSPQDEVVWNQELVTAKFPPDRWTRSQRP